MPKPRTRRLRLTRMRNRTTEPQRAREQREALAGLLAFTTAPVSDDEAAAWQRAWDEAMADDPTAGRTSGPRWEPDTAREPADLPLWRPSRRTLAECAVLIAIGLIALAIHLLNP